MFMQMRNRDYDRPKKRRKNKGPKYPPDPLTWQDYVFVFLSTLAMFSVLLLCFFLLWLVR